MFKTLWLQIKGSLRKTVNENTDLSVAGQEHIHEINTSIEDVRAQRNRMADVEFEQTVYTRACKLIESNPEKLTFDQVVQGLNLTPDQSDHDAINLAFGWASQAHFAYLEDN